MQPFQSDLLPQLQDTQRTTHTGTTTRCKTHRRNQSRPERPQPHPPHTRRTFHRRLLPLYTVKHKVSCSGFLPKTWPMQHSCSHSTAICNQRFKTRIEHHRTTHIGTATRCRTQRRNQFAHETTPAAPAGHRRYTFHRRLQPLYTEKHKVSCSGFHPKTKPMQHSCSHYNAFRSITSQTCTYLRTWQHQMTTIMQPFHCDLQPQIQDTHRTTHIGTATRCRTQGRNQFAHETTPAAPAGHRRYLSSPPAASLHGKTQGFVLRLPPQNKAHATFM